MGRFVIGWTERDRSSIMGLFFRAITQFLTLLLVFFIIANLWLLGLTWATSLLVPYVGGLNDYLPTAVLILAAFFTGVTHRYLMNQFRIEGQQLIHLGLGLLAYSLFVYLTAKTTAIVWDDVIIYRPFSLENSATPWLWGTPLIYLTGIVFSGFFTLETD